VGLFDLDGISGGSAVFNPDKLDWFNQQHLMRLAPVELARRLKPWFEAEGLWDEAFLDDRHAWFFAVLELLKPRARRLTEFASVGRFFFVDTVEYDQTAIEKHLRDAVKAGHLAAMDTELCGLETFDPAAIEAALRRVAEARSVKAATLIHALRVAITGRSVSPGVFEVASLVGRDRTHARIGEAIRLIV
jgi:glutamyl-tRNA synthetase